MSEHCPTCGQPVTTFRCGHLRTPENSYVLKDGSQRCETCRRAARARCVRKTGPCMTCLRVRRLTKGECSRCYCWRRTHDGKTRPNVPRITDRICRSCGQRKPHEALGYCKNCYVKAWRLGLNRAG